MYLIAQLWWYLLLAFLLGALCGYLLWRACGRRYIASQYLGERKEISIQLTQLETERANFTRVATDAEARNAALADELAHLKSAGGEQACNAREEKLADELAAFRAQVTAAEAARAADLKKARETVVAEATAKHAEEIKNAREAARQHEARAAALTQADAAQRRELEELKVRHAAQIKQAREEAAATAAQAHAAQIKAARDAQALAASKHSEELQKAHDAARLHEARVRELIEADASARRELDVLKMRHAAEMKTLHSGAAAALDARSAAGGGWRPQDRPMAKPQNLLAAPRAGKADDLKLIWGVGAKLEKMLNGAGIYHFDQIAAWTEHELAWVDSQLGDFTGRAIRDKWIEQAKKLAGGWRPSKSAGDRPV